LEVDPGTGHHHQLAVHHRARWQTFGQDLDDVGKRRCQRPLLSLLQLDPTLGGADSHTD
jgi:hypothetical protein